MHADHRVRVSATTSPAAAGLQLGRGHLSHHRVPEGDGQVIVGLMRETSCEQRDGHVIDVGVGASCPGKDAFGGRVDQFPSCPCSEHADDQGVYWRRDPGASERTQERLAKKVVCGPSRLSLFNGGIDSTAEKTLRIETKVSAVKRRTPDINLTNYGYFVSPDERALCLLLPGRAWSRDRLRTSGCYSARSPRR